VAGTSGGDLSPGIVVFYFTGTGNSLVAARRLARGLAGPPPIPMVQYLDVKVVRPKADTIALVYPVHHWGPADVVLRFARKLKADHGTYVFAVATYGNHSGRAFQGLSKALEEKAHGLTAGFHVKTVQNYVPGFTIPGEGRLNELQTGADSQVDAIIEKVKRKSQGEKEHWRFRPGVRSYYQGSKVNLHKKDKRFSVREGCTSCGVCSRVCPVKNIEMREGKPAWKHRCEQCFGCLHWCPEGVIEWAGVTAGRGRYRHSSVTVTDMEMQTIVPSPDGSG
jgi:ferredoxin